MATRSDQERIRALLTEAITVLCKNGLGYKSEFCIDGLLGITVDNDDIFLVKINEKISREKRSLHLSLEHPREHPREQPFLDRGSVTSVSPDHSSSLSQPPTPHSISNSHHRTDAQPNEVPTRESSPRKRHWDSPPPEPAAKRSHGSSESEAIIIKEEVVSSSELHQHLGVFADHGEEVGLVGVMANPGGGKANSFSWAQTPPTARLSSNVPTYDDSQDDYMDMSVPLHLHPPPSIDEQLASDRSVMINGKGRLISKGMPIPNEERQLIIKTILEAGGNSDTGKTPYGVLKGVADSFHVQPSTVHNIWTRYWKYRIDTHGYCPGISDKKREINKKCKDKKKGRKDSIAEDLSQTDLSCSQELRSKSQVVGIIKIEPVDGDIDNESNVK